MAGHLELRAFDGRGVYFLEDAPVMNGDPLEILLRGAVWLPGSFDWSGFAVDRPRLQTDLGGPWEQRVAGQAVALGNPFVSFALPPEATLRRHAGERSGDARSRSA